MPEKRYTFHLTKWQAAHAVMGLYRIIRDKKAAARKASKRQKETGREAKPGDMACRAMAMADLQMLAEELWKTVQAEDKSTEEAVIVGALDDNSAPGGV